MAAPQSKDLAKRLVVETAFLDYCKLAAISEDDIDRLYERISELNRLDNDDDLEKVIAYNLEAVKNKDDLRTRIKEMRSQTAQKIFDYYSLSDENATAVKLMMTSIGIKKEMAQDLTTAIAERTLDKPFDSNKSMADKLYDILQGKQKALKEKLATDYDTYKQTKTPNIVIEDIEADIQGHLSGIAREESIEYETRKEDYNFRQDLRKDFSHTNGIRPAFLKLYGIMMENGKNLAQNQKANSNYQIFYKQMEQMFGENAQAEIDQALSVPSGIETTAELQKKRLDLYAGKCQEVYFKTMAGILSHKREFDYSKGDNRNDYQIYVQTIERDFIRSLLRGETNIDCLAFVEPDNTFAKNRAEEMALRKKHKDETAENQIVSVHHKLPIGAALDVCRKIFGKKDTKTELASCSSLVNNLGNMSLVIGKQTHQTLEANGNYNVTANGDNMIFASRINKDLLNMERLNVPQYLKDGIRRYALGAPKDNIIRVSMNFTESIEIANRRNKLKMPNVATKVVDKFKQFWKSSPVNCG
ncbi:MAG: hypothetical protein E7010_01720 [Alphaproteobacteria bacterium]|nr:hypothetical protein [Alphaproteobacteria bacterium]